MEKLKLHSSGQDNHLKSLKKEFKTLLNTLKGDSKLSKEEKDIKIKKARESFNEQKKQTKGKLF